MTSFWFFAKQMFRARLMVSMAALFAVLSAGGLGAGLLSIAPILKVILGEDGASLQQMALDHNATGSWFLWPTWITDELPIDPFQSVVVVLVAVGSLTLFGALANFAHQFCSMTVSIMTVAQIRLDAFRHVIEMPLGAVFRVGPSEVVSRINKDAQALQQGFNTLLGKALAQLAKGVAAFLVAVVVDWRLALIAVVLGPIIGLVLRSFGKRIRRGARGSLDAQARLLQISAESIQGLRVIKTSTAERSALARFGKINREVLRQDFRIRTARAISSPLVEVLAIAAVLVLAAVAAAQILDGRLEVDRFILALASLGVAGASLRPLANLINDIQASAAPADRLLELFEQPSERSRDSASVALTRLQPHAGSIDFENVVVRYSGAEHNAVDGVSLSINHGENVAIVGPNGCGKTTLLSLVPALLRPSEGRVLFDGVDLVDVNLRSLRRQIGVVTQDPVIVFGTIEENIRFGLAGVSSDAIREAARLALAEEFIDALPEGFQTAVGEFGSTLSGGQRQRIAIARAVLRDPAILIFDEATSAIDTESESEINDVLNQFGVGRTRLVIAHRPATIMAANRIIVMENGHVIDDGTHDELLARCGLYERLVTTAALD